jgi:beta-phosphoglucomutase-like phosphatase (HAD superfamily)
VPRSFDIIRNRLTGAGLPDFPIPTSSAQTSRGASRIRRQSARLGSARLGWPSAAVTVVEDAAVGVAAGLAASSTVTAVATTYDAAQLRSAPVIVADVAGLSVEPSGEFLIITPRQD